MWDIKVDSEGLKAVANRFSDVNDALICIQGSLQGLCQYEVESLDKPIRLTASCCDSLRRVASNIEWTENMLLNTDPLSYRPPIIKQFYDLGRLWDKGKEEFEIIYWIDLYGVPVLKVIGGAATVVGSIFLEPWSAGLSTITLILGANTFLSGLYDFYVIFDTGKKSDSNLLGEGIQVLFGVVDNILGSGSTFENVSGLLFDTFDLAWSAATLSPSSIAKAASVGARVVKTIDTTASYIGLVKGVIDFWIEYHRLPESSFDFEKI